MNNITYSDKILEQKLILKNIDKSGSTVTVTIEDFKYISIPDVRKSSWTSDHCILNEQTDEYIYKNGIDHMNFLKVNGIVIENPRLDNIPISSSHNFVIVNDNGNYKLIIGMNTLKSEIGVKHDLLANHRSLYIAGELLRESEKEFKFNFQSSGIYTSKRLLQKFNNVSMRKIPEVDPTAKIYFPNFDEIDLSIHFTDDDMRNNVYEILYIPLMQMILKNVLADGDQTVNFTYVVEGIHIHYKVSIDVCPDDIYMTQLAKYSNMNNTDQVCIDLKSNFKENTGKYLQKYDNKTYKCLHDDTLTDAQDDVLIGVQDDVLIGVQDDALIIDTLLHKIGKN